MSNIKVGDIVKGQITGMTSYGVFVSLEDDYTGLVHISEVSNSFIKNLKTIFNIGNIINVKVLEINENNRQVDLSIRKIDYKVEESLSSIPESGTGFGMLRENLDQWIRSTMSQIDTKI